MTNKKKHLRIMIIGLVLAIISVVIIVGLLGKKVSKPKVTIIGPILPDAREIKVAKVTPLTMDVEHYMAPQWSPDGQKIAFSKLGFKGLWIMDDKGANKKQLTDEEGAGYKFSWSADSKEIAYRVDRFQEEKIYNAIKKVNIKTGEKERLFDFTRNLCPPYWTYFPVGTYVSFIHKGGREDILVGPKMSDQFLQYLTDLSHANEILYFTDNNIWLINAKGNKTKQLTKDIGFDPLWSPDRRKIVYSKWDNLIVINPDSGESLDLGYGINPTWSPGSEKIAYQVSQDNGHQIIASDLYIINVDGTGKTQLTNTEDEIELEPSWSPDGKKIIYRSGITDQIYRLNLNWQ